MIFKKIFITSSLLLNFAYSFVSVDAIGSEGVAVSSKHEASKIGLDVLKDGGNAIDAAVAIGFALAVTHPGAGNIGGGGFMVIRFPNGEVTTIDFREKAPNLSSRDMYLDENGEVIPGLSWSSVLSTGVPGSVAGLGYAHKKYGSLEWSKLIHPSIILSKYGYNLDYNNVSLMNSKRYKYKLSQDIETKKIFSKESDFAINELFIQTDLSKTLERISSYGYNEFYHGETADKIIDCMNRTGGIITYLDLESYIPLEKKPITFTYRNYKIHSMPLPSSGGITIANILNQLENVDFSNIGYHSSEHIHYLVESERRAYSDRAKYLGDDNFVDVPVDMLISKEYASKMFNTIKTEKATNSMEIYDSNIIINTESNETTHYSVADKNGMAVSVTTTLNGWYGNGITVDGAGFLLNNEMDDFSIKPGYPNAYGLVGNEANAIEPNKRMLSSMSPTIVEDPQGNLFLVVGSPGGSTIITTVTQILSNVIDFNMEIDQAVESRRLHHQCLPDVIQLENYTLPYDVINKLSSYGHSFKYRSSIGEANCIMFKNNMFFGSADSRRNASALAY